MSVDLQLPLFDIFFNRFRFRSGIMSLLLLRGEPFSPAAAAGEFFPFLAPRGAFSASHSTAHQPRGSLLLYPVVPAFKCRMPGIFVPVLLKHIHAIFLFILSFCSTIVYNKCTADFMKKEAWQG